MRGLAARQLGDMLRRHTPDDVELATLEATTAVLISGLILPFTRSILEVPLEITGVPGQLHDPIWLIADEPVGLGAVRLGRDRLGAIAGQDRGVPRPGDRRPRRIRNRQREPDCVIVHCLGFLDQGGAGANDRADRWVGKPFVGGDDIVRVPFRDSGTSHAIAAGRAQRLRIQAGAGRGRGPCRGAHQSDCRVIAASSATSSACRNGRMLTMLLKRMRLVVRAAAAISRLGDGTAPSVADGARKTRSDRCRCVPRARLLRAGAGRFPYASNFRAGWSSTRWRVHRLILPGFRRQRAAAWHARGRMVLAAASSVNLAETEEEVHKYQANSSRATSITTKSWASTSRP